MPNRFSPIALVSLMCFAQVLAMLGAFAFPALLPTFVTEWQLSNTRAGWINGVYFAAYALTVPLFSGMTDRTDARFVFAAGALTTATAGAGFMLLAQGFWSATVFRALGGAGLAGTFMPGVRLIVDRYAGRRQPRAIAFYTASFSLGTATSFFAAGAVAEGFGWRAAFAVAAAGAAAAATLVLLLQRVEPERAVVSAALFDPRPVLRNRTAMGYVLAYGAHSWELFALRSWLVAFLAFSLSLQPAGSFRMEPTLVATLSGLVAVVASVVGAELAVRFGLPRLISTVMMLSAAMALAIGFLAGIPYEILILLVLIYSVAVQLDSAALTIGATTSAEPGRRGATLAMHALVGFGCAALGPLALGAVLDLADASRPSAWGLAFATIGLVAALGPVALRLLVRNGQPVAP